MKRTACWMLVTVFGCICGSPAWAANVWGFGVIATQPSFESVEPGDTEYEDPVSLNVRRIVQLNESEVGPGGQMVFDHLGQAQFGRLRARSQVGGHAFSMPELDGSVDIGMEFQDQITPQDLDPLESYLRLDIELSGVMSKTNDSFSNGAVAHFLVTMLDLDGANFKNMCSVMFRWSGESFTTVNESDNGQVSPRFVPYPGEEPRFTQLTPGGDQEARYSFRARGYLDVPLGGGGAVAGLEPGEPFQLWVAVDAFAGCGLVPCSTTTDFDEATIRNAHIVDQNGDPVAGASFTSASGDDYDAPPDALPVPEAEAFATGAVALGLLGLMARRCRG